MADRTIISMPWKPENFHIARFWGPDATPGYVHKGLGLSMAIKGSPKGRRPPRWALIHLGSGHLVCFIEGTVAEAFLIATEIADCGDWDFDGLMGWKNRDPEVPTKVAEIFKVYPKRIIGMRGQSAGHEAVAAQIATMRA